MKVHPLADIFPMMSDEELDGLAADIKANGLRYPIVTGMATNSEGELEEVLIDGRNRLRACEIAEVKPRFEKLNGHDPAAFIVSANLARRNLTKGQQAMALAMIYPEPERGRGKKDPALLKVPETGGFKRERLRQARAVLHTSTPTAQRVIAGDISLDAALAIVRAAEAIKDPDEQKRERLLKEASDLLDRVEMGMNIDEAIAALNERQRKDRVTREQGLAAANNLLDFCGMVLAIDAAMQLGEDDLLDPDTVERVMEAADHLAELAKKGAQ